MLENIVYVYNKHGDLIAQFDGDGSALNSDEIKNQMVSPTVHIETNGESSFTFQMLANSEKWQQIKDAENLFYVNGKYYTWLKENGIEYTGDDGVRLVKANLVETWYLLGRQYTQAYNCGLYCYAKASFYRFVPDGVQFRITSTGCSNPGNSISTALAWEQVSLWTPQDDKDRDITYTILKTDDYKPTNWENAPDGVFFSATSVSGSTMTVTLKSRVTQERTQMFTYVANGTYTVDVKPYPSKLTKVYVNSTIVTESNQTTNGVTSTIKTYETKDRDASVRTWNNSTGQFTITYNKASNETINSVSAVYDYGDLGDLQTTSTCTFAYGAEVLDEHTFVILPKSKTKYRLTIQGKSYNDSEVVDMRGVLMPRGSAGYALWAALKNTDWSIGICDVIAKNFDASIDYGVFNIESDQKDVLYIIQYIQELYGGILVFDSVNKLVHLRAENYDDYTAYEDDGFNTWTGYEFREGKNMLEQPTITYDNDIITRAYLLGYSGLNVKKVNGGKTYIEDFSYTDRVYSGYLEQELIYDTNDEGGMNQLLYWGKKELRKRCKPRRNFSFSVTDLRSVNGYEHEVFDINNIVRCYYKDSHDGTESYEDKRVILWEYNVFAPWECKVELGDKVANMRELFELIYRSTVNNPDANATGKISSTSVYFPFIGTGDSDLNGSLNGNLDNYLSLIMQKETANSNAISGLYIQVSDTSAYSELFAQYSSTTDRLISETYAGLKVYADKEISTLDAIVTGHYTEFNNFKVDTAAGFTAMQGKIDDNYVAMTNQFSQVNNAISGVRTYAETAANNAYSNAILYAGNLVDDGLAFVETSYDSSKKMSRVLLHVADQLSGVADIELRAGNWSGGTASGIFMKSIFNIELAGPHIAFNGFTDLKFSGGTVDFTGVQTITGVTANFA